MDPIQTKQPTWFKRIACDYFGIVLALVVLVVIFGIKANNFFSPVTFQTIANQVPDATIIAVGMTFVLIIGGIDLSVGSVLALASAVLGVCLANWGWSLPVAIGMCLLVGLVCGALNGLIVVRWKLPSFIVTLGMLEAARGAVYLVTKSRTLYVSGAIERIASPENPTLSLAFVLALLIVIVAQLVLSYTVFGRYLIAIGTNEEAVRLSGIDPRRYKLAVFVLCSLLAAIGGMIHTSRMSAANPNAGIGLELEAIAAVVIGGTSLMGGRGSVVRSFLGVLIIAVLGAGLAQMGAQEYTKRLITGCVIVAAVIVDQYRRRVR